MTSITFQRAMFRNFSFIKQSHVFKTPKQRILTNSNFKYHKLTKNQIVLHPKYVSKLYATSNHNGNTTPKTEINTDSTDSTINCPKEEAKPGLFKRFKQMYRDYWYVLVPVHLITSAGWFGTFYYMAKSGVDVASLLHGIGVSEKITNPLKDSQMGYIAISYALYKIATPLRYTVTLGGTTITINYLRNLGYIKPVPSKEKLKEIINVKRVSFKESIQETKQELRQRKDQLKERKDNIMGDYVTFKKELKDIKAK